MLSENLSTSPVTTPRPPRRRRGALRVTGIVAVALTAALLASTTANLAMEGREKSATAPYGERVHIAQGSINVTRSGDSGPAVVFLSGLGTPAPGLDFAPLLRDLDGFQSVVVEGFGYGYSDPAARPRTVENITEELHEVISKLGLTTPYVLAGHSIAGFYTLHYANTYPKEVSAVIGIDPTVPTVAASDVKEPAASPMPAGKNFWAHIPSTTGLIRWATDLGYGEPGGNALTSDERQQMRQLTIWDFGNQAVTDETLRMGEMTKLRDMRYPDNIPVLDFLSQETMDQNANWLGAHERQLANVTNHELLVLNGPHYLHWTLAGTMALKIRGFLSQTGIK
ncbi:alpha/beta hydrolase [Arthrobacter sp. LAPM80]|uniref:alpha/beta fold hydrolase n=1 Tax=Arthrobacter sp. LAPM80 TaxID=3141788 RepID=UPI00398B7E1A